MRLTMKERKTLTKALAEQYRRGAKNVKGAILDQFTEAAGYNRCYARRLLRDHGKRVYVSPNRAVEGDAHLRPQRARRRTYDEEVLAPLAKITFTRSRPYRKNDNCYVEQKNWSVVRRFAGYARYDTPEAIQILNELYSVLFDYNNFFLPSQKLKERTQDGARVRRIYHPAQTPYQRVMESPHVDPAVKETLEAHYHTLNPAALHRQIQKCQQKLLKLTARQPQPEEIPHDEFTAFVPIRRTKKNRGGRTAPILRLGP